ncbi:MAG: chromosomal replication initiator protein DnaA [Pseudomonadales bacterium]
MRTSVWQHCLERLEEELLPQQFNTWIRPLQAHPDGERLRLLAPNRYVRNEVQSAYFDRILELVASVTNRSSNELVSLEIGTVNETVNQTAPTPLRADGSGGMQAREQSQRVQRGIRTAGRSSDGWASGSVSNELNEEYVFSTFVEGKSNEMAKEAAMQVSANAGRSYNPLLLYGGVGLGKTHLMQAVGNAIKASDPQAKVVYLHSQRFVQDMVKALQQGTMDLFMQFYRSVDTLLIDDIQFFANKLRSQEEFFHVFNALLEGGKQMVLTCDRYPREIEGLEERLKSRFVHGLTQEVEPPELETRVAILMKKAEAEGIELDANVAFFIGERIRSNVRELEGALRRVIANARFTGSRITIDQVKRALRDLLAIQERQITVDNIQKVTAEYYNIKISDMLSKRRSRTVARPRQMAMFLAKELTNHSLPEIGESFGGRDHTTVLHACRRIAELKEQSSDIGEDHRNLTRLLLNS